MEKRYLTRLLQKRDTSSNWTKNDPVIFNGEIILVDTDSGELKAKIGDGVKKYTQLPFSDEVLRSLVNEREKLSNKTNDITSSSTAEQYPSAKAVYDFVNDRNTPIVVQTEEPEDKNVIWFDPDDDTMDEAESSIRYDIAQNLTEAQKAQARANIGALDKSQLPTIVQEAGESESLVMSQKAVTDLVAEAIGTGGGSVQYETVESVDDMTDTSKQYVLKETGTIWAFGETLVEKEPENVFNKSTAEINARLSSLGTITSSTNGSKGCFVTDYIQLTNWANLDTFIVRINFELQSINIDANGVYFYDSSKAYLNGQGIIRYDPSTTSLTQSEIIVGNGVSSINLKQWGAYANAEYVRFRFYKKTSGTDLAASDLDDVEITFDADGGTETVNAWYDTGLTPSEMSSGGGNYVNLLTKVNKNASDISEVSNRVTALESGRDTVTVPTFWQDAVDVCIAKIKALQKDAGINALTFPFFSDNHQRNGYAGVLIKAVMDECHIPYAFFGGDSISSGYIETETEMIEQDKAFDTVMSYIPNGRFCRTVGNHDGFWKTSTGITHSYTRAQIYDLFLREEGISQEKHFGADGTYYYVDDIASKIRFIVVNANEIDSAQLNWIKTVALNISESGWSVVFISHQPICNAYHTNIINAATVISDVTSTAAGKVDIIGWFSGHVHRDRIFTHLLTGGTDTTAGTASTALGFTNVTITSDATNIAYKNDDGTVSDTNHAIANDDKSHAIDFVTINKKTRTVNLTRLGIGSDRSFTY